MGQDTTKELGRAIKIDAGQIKGHIDEVVRSSVEETLNGLPDRRAWPATGRDTEFAHDAVIA